MRLRLVRELPPAAHHPLRQSSLHLPRNRPRAAIRQQSRYLEHRHPHLRTALRPRALRNLVRRGSFQGGRRRHLLPSEQAGLSGNQGLYTGLPGQEPQGTLHHRQTDRPRVPKPKMGGTQIYLILMQFLTAKRNHQHSQFFSPLPFTSLFSIFMLLEGLAVSL